MHAAVGKKEKHLTTFNRPQLHLMDMLFANEVVSHFV